VLLQPSMRVLRALLPAVTLILAALLGQACSGGTPGPNAALDGGGDATPGDAGGPDVGPQDTGISDSGVADGAPADSGCMGASPSFANDVTPILGNCGASEYCHGGLLQPWPYSSLVNVPSSNGCDAGVLVLPGSIEDSYLMHKLTGVGMCPGTSQMPKDEPPLPESQITLVADWICAGALNN